MKKRALMLNGGTMRGAYLVGALKVIHKELGVDYFDAIYSTSVGVFEQAFFASEQTYFMENTWKDYVHGTQLINPLNFFKGKPILDLDYLTNLFQSEKSMLDIEAMKNSKPQLFTFVADYETKEPKLLNLKESNVFDVMKATCALPYVYPKKVLIDNKRYVDGFLCPPSTFKRFIHETLNNYDEVLVVSSHKTKDDRFSGLKYLIEPQNLPLKRPFDTNRERIIETIRQGEAEAEEFLQNYLKN